MIDDQHPKAISHRLKSLTIMGGFLDGQTFEFADGLNCIIGGRGAGKTTVIELIRVALDAMPDDAAAKRVMSLVAKNLDFGRVELAIETSSGMAYIVSRAHDGESVVMTDDRTPTDLVLQSGSLFRADIFSQNEVEGIADRSDSQLGLTDSFNQTEIGDLSAQTSRIALGATGLSRDILQSRSKIALLKQGEGFMATITLPINCEDDEE